MTTNQEAKKAIIDEIKANIQNAKSIVLVDYRGISVAEDTTLRKDLRENNVVYKVYKNRLFQKACEELGINGFESYLEGTTAFAFGMEDETAAPRLIKKQIKEHSAQVMSEFTLLIFLLITHVKFFVIFKAIKLIQKFKNS